MLLSMLLCIVGAAQAITDDRTKHGLTEFPSNVSADVTVLILDSNSISHVPAEALQGLPVLEKLSLGGNSLSVFPNLTAVAGSLTQLVLHHNNISFMDAQLVEALYRLAVLSLPSNKLVTFPELASGACHSLQIINLEVNPLVSPVSFRYYTALTFINLLMTSLTDMPDLGEALLPSLKHLRVEGPFTIPAATFTRLTALRRLDMPRSRVTTLTNPCNYVGELNLLGNPLDVCACKHLWLKLVATMGSSVVVPDANCSGIMWSAMTLQHFQEACTVQPSAGMNEGHFQRVWRSFYCAFPTHSLLADMTLLRCLGVCLRVPGCVSFNFRRRAGDKGDCVILAPGGSLDLTVADTTDPAWMYYAL